MELSLLTHIKEHYNNFSKTEKQIATYVLKYAKLIPNITTKELADKAVVSESSVTRFVKKAGAESFKSFKIRLAQELVGADGFITDFSILHKKDTPYELFQKVSHVNKGAIDALHGSMNKKELSKAIEALKKARKIVFYGVGGSSIVAMDALYKFTKLGFQVEFNQDFHYMLSLIPFLNKDDVFVAISMSGKTKDVADLAEFAQLNNTLVIAITNINKSTLVKKADIHLATPKVEQDFRIGSITSRITQLTIIDSLYVNLFNMIGDKVLDKYKTAREEMVKLRR